MREISKQTATLHEREVKRSKMKFMKVIFLFTLVIVAINGLTPAEKKDKNPNEVKDEEMYDEITDKVIESKPTRKINFFENIEWCGMKLIFLDPI